MPYKDPDVHRAYQREHFKRKRWAFKQACLEYKGRVCERCGYSRSPQALQFHHPDDNKEFTISRAYDKSWDEVVDELDKCVLLCANCHAEGHDERLD